MSKAKREPTKRTPPLLMPTSPEAPEQWSHPDFNRVAERVFTVKGTQVFIGGHPVSKEMRDLLREQARYLATSQLWEIFNAAIIHESADLALRQSQDWDQVLSAKMLHHWGHFFRNSIHTLSQSAEPT